MSAAAQQQRDTASVGEKPRSGFFYGYVLVVVLGFLYFCSSGIILASATIINPLMLQDVSLGMNATMLGTGFSLFVLVQGLSAPLVGALISRKGARFSMTLGAVILLASMLALIFVVASAPAYFVVFGIIASAATMMVGQLAVQSTVGNWFVTHRGVAMTCMMVIGASASFIAPPVVNAIIGLTGGGWRSGWYLVAVLAAAAVPTAFFLVKNTPADIGQVPDGKLSVGGRGGKATRGFSVYKNPDSVPFSRAIRTPAFWLISLAATSGFAAYTLSTSQGVLHFGALGFDNASIVAGVALMGATGLVGKISMGIVSDRIEPIRLIVVAAVILAVGTVVGAAASSRAMLFIFYGCIGIGFGGVNAVFPTAMANYFGAGSLSKNLGVGIMVTTLIASALPIMSGAFFDATGSCALAFYVTAGIVAVCAACGMLVRIPKERG